MENKDILVFEEKVGPELMVKLREVSASVLKFIESDVQFHTGHVAWLIEPMVEADFPRLVAASAVLILQLEGKLAIADDGWFKLMEAN